MLASRSTHREGFSLVEILSVICVVALLLGTGFLLYRSMRRAARLALAETRLGQVAAGLELYFRVPSAAPSGDTISSNPSSPVYPVRATRAGFPVTSPSTKR